MISEESQQLLREMVRSEGFKKLIREVSAIEADASVDKVREAVTRGALTDAALAEGQATAWQRLLSTLQTHSERK